MKKISRHIKYFFAAAILVLLGAGIFYFFHSKKAELPPKDLYAGFAIEAYDSILQNFWMTKQDLGEEKLAGLFELAINQTSNGTTTLSSKDRKGVVRIVMDVRL